MPGVRNTGQLIDENGERQKEDERNEPKLALYCYSHALRSLAWFMASVNASDKPPVSWRERTSHVTGHFPATHDVDSEKIDH